MKVLTQADCQATIIKANGETLKETIIIPRNNWKYQNQNNTNTALISEDEKVKYLIISLKPGETYKSDETAGRVTGTILMSENGGVLVDIHNNQRHLSQ